MPQSEPVPDGDPSEKDPTAEPSEGQADSALAQAARFAGTRRNLGEFARSGNQAKMRAGVASYVTSGYGGSKTAAQRLVSTSATAGRLFSFLAASPVAGGPGQPGPADPRLQAGRSARDIIDAVIQGVQPVNGTLDGEASRHAIDAALSELLTQFPQADLLALTPDQLQLVVELYVAQDVFFHIELDVGQALRQQGVSALMLTDRLRQVRDYVQSTVAAAFSELRQSGQALTARNAQAVTQRALERTMEVFSQ